MSEIRSLPRPEQEEGNGVPNNTYPAHKLTLPFDIIRERGYISESDLFNCFWNRKIAIEFIRKMTSGKYHALDSEIHDGMRFYFLHRCPDRFLCPAGLNCGKSTCPKGERV